MSMTENEIIKMLEVEKAYMDSHGGRSQSEALAYAIESVKEIQQYIEIGTVEELIKTQIREKVLNVELESYKEIGTIEEFKALKQKNNEHYSDTDELDGYGYTCTNKTCVERIRNKAIDEFYDEVLNFEDYIEPSGTSEFGSVLLYSGKDITNMICKIAEQMKVGGENE